MTFLRSHGLLDSLQTFLAGHGGRAACEAALRDVFRCRNIAPGRASEWMRELVGDDPRFAVRARQVSLSPQAPVPAVALGEARFAVVDFETTGCGATARAIEIGVVVARGGTVEQEFGTLLNPGMPVSSFITDLTGITGAMLADAPRFEEVSPRIGGLLEDAVTTAHNLPFDRAFLWREFQRAESRIPVHPSLCTLALARRLLPKDTGKGLDALAAHFDVEIDGRHRALGDARATARILGRLLELAEERGVHDLPTLLAFASGPLRRAKKTAAGTEKA